MGACETSLLGHAGSATSFAGSGCVGRRFLASRRGGAEGGYFAESDVGPSRRWGRRQTPRNRCPKSQAPPSASGAVEPRGRGIQPLGGSDRAPVGPSCRRTCAGRSAVAPHDAGSRCLGEHAAVRGSGAPLRHLYAGFRCRRDHREAALCPHFPRRLRFRVAATQAGVSLGQGARRRGNQRLLRTCL